MPATGNNITSRKQRLTIRVSRGSLSFSVADATSEHQILYTPYTVKSGISMAANLRQAFKSDAWYANGWHNALVMIDTPVLMVPAEEFDAGACATMYNHALTGHKGDLIMHTTLPALNAVAVYSVNKDLKLVIDDNFSDAKFAHVCAPVWNHLYRRSFTGVHNKLYGYFHDKKLELFSFQQNRFRFCNTFGVTSAQDAAYFILFVWKQLGLDQRRDELHLAGDIPERENTIDGLRRYLQNAYVINPTADFNRAPITRIKGLPYDLLTLYVRGR